MVGRSVLELPKVDYVLALVFLPVPLEWAAAKLTHISNHFVLQDESQLSQIAGVLLIGKGTLVIFLKSFRNDLKPPRAAQFPASTCLRRVQLTSSNTLPPLIHCRQRAQIKAPVPQLLEGNANHALSNSHSTKPPSLV
jgi:hypothetical protein